MFARQVEWLDAKVGVKGETVLFRDKSRFGYRYSNMCELEGETLYGERLYSEGVETDPYLRAFLLIFQIDPFVTNARLKSVIALLI